MIGYISRTQWGWSLYADGGLVASANRAADLWSLALSLEIGVSA